MARMTPVDRIMSPARSCRRNSTRVGRVPQLGRAFSGRRISRTSSRIQTRRHHCSRRFSRIVRNVSTRTKFHGHWLPLFHTSRKPSPLTHPRMNRTRTRIIALGLSIVAAAPFPGGAQKAAAPSSSGAIRVPVREVHATERAHGHPRAGSLHADRRRRGPVPCRLEERNARPHRLRAPVRARDVHGLGSRALRHCTTNTPKASAAATTGTRPTTSPSYCETVPSNYLEHALWLESDRMGWLLDALDVAKYNAQRDIVQNERRQSVDNQPYGRSNEIISAAMYPSTHPYSWPVIGSLADLQAASVEDVKAFFRLYYAPNNATLAIIGDFDPAQTKAWIAKYFAGVAARQADRAADRSADSHGRGEAIGVRGSRADSAACISPGPRSARTTTISTRSTCSPTCSRVRASRD